MDTSAEEPGRHRGVAIVVVLSLLSLTGILLTGLLAASRTELISAGNEVAHLKASNYADLATNLVIGQIRTGTDDEGRAWATQPGALRSFDESGKTAKVFKLYSDEQMISEPASLSSDANDISTWDRDPVQFVDLNAPLTYDGLPEFPILDPRAFAFGIRGFHYDPDAVPGSVGIDSLPDSFDTTPLRVPMPVRWLYVLKDGTVGYLDEDNQFVGPVVPSQLNPISGRIAFWTDDECAKLNFNTASCPTYWDTPRAGSVTNSDGYSETGDRHFAKYQPAQREYQRYPGHPATTTMSPVFFPTRIFWGSHLTSWERLNNKIFKEALYDLTPNIVAGGSTSGTVEGGSGRIEVLPVRRERRYASADEMVFLPDRTRNTDRSGNMSVNGEGLRRIMFFVSAKSRAPELNLFGLPRISIWPTANSETGDGDIRKRTAFDELMRFCGSFGEERHAYYFQRENPDSPTHDFESISRNRELYRYLQRLTSQPIPGFGGRFSSKYGADRDQILTEIFDYIRSTNLYDDNLSPLRYDESQADTFLQVGGYKSVAQYTRGRREHETGVWPGHGQVTPIEIGDTRGFGRFVTASEVGIHFICNADAGGPDPADDSQPEYPDPDDPSESEGVRGSNVQENRALQPTPGATFERLDWRKNERSVQAALLFEFFCPSLGWTTYHGDYEVKVTITRPFQVRTPENGLQQLRFPTDGLERLFQSPDVQTDFAASSQMGGTVGFRHALKNGEAPPMRGFQQTSPGAIEAYNQKGNRKAYPFVSEPLYLDAESGRMEFLGGELKLEIYSGRHQEREPVLVQEIAVEFPEHGQMPIPELVQSGTSQGGGPVTLPEYWWSFHQDGVGINPSMAPDDSADIFAAPVPNGGNAGRLRYANRTVVEGSTGSASYRPLSGAFFRSGDVVRTVVPRHADYRLLAAKQNVPKSDWAPHPGYFGTALPERLPVTTVNSPSGPVEVESANRTTWLGLASRDTAISHQFPGAWGTDQIIAYDRTGALVPAIDFEAMDHPDFPATADAIRGQTRGDFDNGVGVVFDGAYINKPDEGNLRWIGSGSGDAPYFWNQPQQSIEDQPSFFSPNRQIPSPVMFGSLPSGVKSGEPWRTLLFRPQKDHEGHEDPKDHLLLDLFWMPVVEPIALSEAFSTEGKINLNYEIVPFSHIERSTGIYALLRGEEVMAIPSDEAGAYKRFDGKQVGDHIRWPVDVDETLKQFERKFDSGELFKSASEICELHLVPDKPGIDLEDMEEEFEDTRYPNMKSKFWWDHRLTGDNSRERPYASIYPRATTQSNTFRIHIIAQTIRKARSVSHQQFDPARDEIASEYRGSRLIERYLDEDMEVGDHATNPDLEPLTKFYRFRVTNEKNYNR